MADVYPARLENYKMGGKLYALPIDNGAEAVYYNKEHFDRAGVPYPKDDWTWDDLLDKARRLTRRDDPAGPVWGFEYRTTLHRFYSPFAGHGGEYFDKDLTRTRVRRRAVGAGPAVVPRPALQARRLAHAPAGRPGAAGRRWGPGLPHGPLRHGVHLDRAHRRAAHAQVPPRRRVGCGAHPQGHGGGQALQHRQRAGLRRRPGGEAAGRRLDLQPRSCSPTRSRSCWA